MHCTGRDNANAKNRYLVIHAVRFRMNAELIALNFCKISKGNDDSELWYFEVSRYFLFFFFV